MNLPTRTFAVNTPNRCYHCKTELFSELQTVARERNIPWIVDGSHADDGKPGDHRPGMRAAEERGVRSPLREAGMTKADVRALALHLGVPNWDKPSFACLSSRFPYGTEITAPLLAQLDGCEKFLRELGFRQFRVRHHDTVARIEVEPQDIVRLVELREADQRPLQGTGLYLCHARSGRLPFGQDERYAGEKARYGSAFFHTTHQEVNGLFALFLKYVKYVMEMLSQGRCIRVMEKQDARSSALSIRLIFVRSRERDRERNDHENY